MGTDIHGFIQVRYSESERYASVGEIEDGRNYAVFSILAGVRNRYGIIPICEPRGLPKDLGWKDPWDQAEFDNWDFGDHSHSWLNLREVLDWPHWSGSLEQGGFLCREQYKRFKAGELPTAWCQGISGPNIVTTTDEAVMAGIAPEGWTHVSCIWSQPILDCVRTFRLWLDYMESKYEWLIGNDPTAVRIVFGFDS